MTRSSRVLTCALVLALLATILPARGAAAATDLLLILDASGSMWGQIEGENKIVIARRVLKDLVAELPEDSEIGLVAYGHRREGDCEDVETVAAIGPLDRGALGATVDGLNPKGKTPITRSINQAAELVKTRGAPTTVVLLSDGLETCGGDPCAAVRAAREAGVELVMHIVGFDVGGEDVSQLECAAQAGGGLYIDAQNADELAAALDQAVAVPAEVPPGRLVVKVIADGKLQDASVRVVDTTTGEDVAGGRTYSGPETNPRILPLPDGTYDVTVKAVGIKGEVSRRFDGVVIADGGTVEKEVDFSSGELAIKVTRNGALGDATVRVMTAGTTQQMAAGRTYTSEQHNPKVVRLIAGDYDVEIGSVEIAGKPTHVFTGVTVPPGGRVERAHEFVSGTLEVTAASGDELVDAVVHVRDAAADTAVAQGRTYTSERSNPKVFELSPGRYRVTVKPVGKTDWQPREMEIDVAAGGVAEATVDFVAE